MVDRKKGRKRGPSLPDTGEEQFHALLGNNPLPAFVIDVHSGDPEQYRFLGANRAAVTLYGYSEEELKSMRLLELHPPEELPDVIEQMVPDRRPEAGGFETQHPFIHVKKDGSRIHVDVYAHRVRFDGRKALISVVRNVSEREKTDQRLRLFSAAVASAPIGVQLVDLDGRVIYSNQAVERLYGFSHEEYLGKHVNDMNADPTFAERKILPSIKKKGRWAGELEVKHKEGHTFPVALTTSIVHDDEGKPLAMVGLIQDVAGQKKAETALRKSEELFRTAFQISPESLVISRLKDGLFINVNQGFCDLSGYERDEVIGKTSTEIGVWVNPESREKMVEGLEKDGLVRNLDLRIKRKDKKMRNVSFSAAVLMTGDEPQLLTVSRDITELKMAQDSLEQAYNELEVKNRDLEAFLYTAAHDLRTPLVSVKGYVELMQRSMKERMSEEEKRMCRRISSNVDHFDNLLSDLLSFSRAGVQNGERARIRIEPLVMRILEEEKAWDVAPGVKVQVVQDLPDVSLHEVRAYEVFSNLISNCLKFRHPDRALRIVVGFKSDDGELIPSGHALLFVRDNGKGIEKGFQHRAFDLFTRPRDAQMEGTGVGLAIVKRVVDEEGGRIWMESTSRKGTTVYFTLPVAD